MTHLRGRQIRVLVIDDLPAHREAWSGACRTAVAGLPGQYECVIDDCDGPDAAETKLYPQGSQEPTGDYDIIVTDNVFGGEMAGALGQALIAKLQRRPCIKILLSQYTPNDSIVEFVNKHDATYVPVTFEGEAVSVPARLSLLSILRVKLAERLDTLRLPATAEARIAAQTVALSSESTPEDGKQEDAVPKVGAILVDALSGHELRRAARTAKGSNGLHAEFQVLSSVSSPDQSDDPELASRIHRSVLFTSLEPCTKRGKGKIPCVQRILTAKLRRVVVGMIDPNRKVHGLGILQLLRAGVRVDFFPSLAANEMLATNAAFISRMIDESTAEGRLLRDLWTGETGA